MGGGGRWEMPWGRQHTAAETAAPQPRPASSAGATPRGCPRQRAASPLRKNALPGVGQRWPGGRRQLAISGAVAWLEGPLLESGVDLVSQQRTRSNNAGIWPIGDTGVSASAAAFGAVVSNSASTSCACSADAESWTREGTCMELQYRPGEVAQDPAAAGMADERRIAVPGVAADC